MSFLVAAIEHHARQLGRAVVRAIGEKCSGFSDYEAGDFLDDTCLFCGKPRTEKFCRPGVLHGGQDWADALTEFEAEQEVAEPDYVRYMVADKGGRYTTVIPDGPPIDMRDITVGDQYCVLCGANITAVSFHACPRLTGLEPPVVPEAVSADPSPAPASGLTPTWLIDLIDTTVEWCTDVHSLKAIETFNEFVRDHVDPSLHAHFADNDDNAAEYVRRAIREGVGASIQFALDTFPQQHRTTQ